MPHIGSEEDDRLCCEVSEFTQPTKSGMEGEIAAGIRLERVILHIGTEKTGTTTIQSFLRDNRKLLAKHGFVVPTTIGQSNHWLLPGIFCESDALEDMFRLMRINNAGDRIRAKASWRDALAAELVAAASSKNAAIISSEHLQSRLRTESELNELANFFRKFANKVNIVLYIRSPLATAVSLYSTAIKNGALMGAIPGPDSPYFKVVVDHARTIRLWSSVFGRNNLIIRLFDRDCLLNGDIVDDFIFTCSLKIGSFAKPKRENESLSALGLELLRRVNARMPLYLPDGSPNPARRGVVSFFESKFSEGQRFTPSVEVIEAYQRVYADSIEWVRNEFLPSRETLFHNPDFGDCETGCEFDSHNLQLIANAICDLWLDRK